MKPPISSCCLQKTNAFADSAESEAKLAASSEESSHFYRGHKSGHIADADNFHNSNMEINTFPYWQEQFHSWYVRLPSPLA